MKVKVLIGISMNVYFQMAFDQIDIPDHDVSIGENSLQERFA